MWLEPSFTPILLSAISQGSGETAQMCSLARSLATHIYDIFHELAYKILAWAFIYIPFLGIRCSHNAISTKISWTGL